MNTTMTDSAVNITNNNYIKVKRCSRCKVNLPSSNFTKTTSYCKECSKIICKEMYTKQCCKCKLIKRKNFILYRFIQY